MSPWKLVWIHEVWSRPSSKCGRDLLGCEVLKRKRFGQAVSLSSQVALDKLEACPHRLLANLELTG